MERKAAEAAQSILRDIMKDNLNDIYPKIWNKLQKWEFDPTLGPDLNACKFIKETPYFDDLNEKAYGEALTQDAKILTNYEKLIKKDCSKAEYTYYREAKNRFERVTSFGLTTLRMGGSDALVKAYKHEVDEIYHDIVHNKCMAFTDLLTLYFHFVQSYIFYDDWGGCFNLNLLYEKDGVTYQGSADNPLLGDINDCFINGKFSMDEYMAITDCELVDKIIPEQRNFSNFVNSYMVFVTSPGNRSAIFAIEFKSDKMIYTLCDITGNGYIAYINTVSKSYDIDMVFYYRNKYYLPAGVYSQSAFPTNDVDKLYDNDIQYEFKYEWTGEGNFIDHDNNENIGLYCLSGIFTIHSMLNNYINREVHVKRSLGVVDRLPPETRKNIEDQHISILDFDYTIYESEGDYEWQGGHHASPTMHERREHKRHYKNGKVVDVRKTTVAPWNPPSQYKTKGEKDEE